ncbi:MFS transporter [Rhodococcus tukisamuensis]|uniref:Predicted arabinose efflux permease, MFS family n=1 Tax=Rhodococcus tukisamuensis TaxID=168276 RepID=A0A1G6U5Y6_9NOCA|nr:MFS transporter [Rhodococcus tukisamuensis]SDD36624.1 Predicted arabinose efflux permease, MFS family [Rhodococcus tukisamuensis]
MRSRLQRGALYAGGFLGPFGGGVVISMLPEMGADLGVSAATAASTVTAYLLPFAALMLISGTYGARWGRLRTVRVAYGGYVLASLLCALAPTFEVFLAGRVLQGAGNAFTTPLLLAALAAVTPRAKLGRALGTFGALQAAGMTTAPIVGGLAAEFEWRLAFVVIAAVALALGAAGLPASSEHATTGPPPRLRDALRPTVLRIGVVSLLGWGALGGVNFLIAFRAEDAFGLEPASRGLLLTGFGIVGMLVARPVGDLIDRYGARTAVLVGSIGGAATVIASGLVGSLAVVAVAWALAGAASQLVLVGVNASILAGTGANRGGAVSVVQAFRFGGGALAPLLLTPLYSVSPAAAFLVPTTALAVLAPLLMPRNGHTAAPERN